MPRTARIAPKEHTYHILTRGNNRQIVFKEDSDYEKYTDIIIKYKNKYSFKLYHYVLMTNHIHLVMEPSQKGGELSQIMKGINLSYAQYYKNKYKHIGHFWQDRYKSVIISKDKYLLACGSYVELNPVRAKIAQDPKEYKWSSYKAYAYGKQDPITDRHPIYEQLSDDETERRQKYREFVKGMQKDKKALKGEMDRRAVYGSEEFTKEIIKQYKIAAVIRPKGRPKSEENKTK
ncbi:MAG: transposase [Dissulfurispiraceae bacterium]|jgi:putative transposase|nr:transposase [Dissulfurispiraceae bacterium]